MNTNSLWKRFSIWSGGSSPRVETDLKSGQNFGSNRGLANNPLAVLKFDIYGFLRVFTGFWVWIITKLSHRWLWRWPCRPWKSIVLQYQAIYSNAEFDGESNSAIKHVLIPSCDWVTAVQSQKASLKRRNTEKVSRGHFAKRRKNLQHQLFSNINYSIQMQNLMENLILLSNVTWMCHLTELRAFKVAGCKKNT